MIYNKILSVYIIVRTQQILIKKKNNKISIIIICKIYLSTYKVEKFWFFFRHVKSWWHIFYVRRSQVDFISYETNTGKMVNFLMWLQVGKLNFIAVRLERIFVGPDDIPIDTLIKRFSRVTVHVEHIENMHQMPSIGLKI